MDGRELPLAQRAVERSARGLGGRKRGGNRGGVVGQEGVVCCRRDGKEELVDKRRARRRVGKRPRQVPGDPGQRVLLDTDKPPEDTPAARVKLGVGGRERRRKRPRSVERTGRCAGVPPTNRLAEGRVERAAERSNRVVPDRPGDLLRALRREVGGDGASASGSSAAVSARLSAVIGATAAIPDATNSFCASALRAIAPSAKAR